MCFSSPIFYVYDQMSCSVSRIDYVKEPLNISYHKFTINMSSGVQERQIIFLDKRKDKSNELIVWSQNSPSSKEKLGNNTCHMGESSSGKRLQ